MSGLFGTDGIRGAVNDEITPGLAHNLGRATARLFEAAGGAVVVGQDTRRSGGMLVAAVSAGLAEMGADALQLGVVTTPCLASVAADPRFAAGIMVSASHNPASDNGLKVVRFGRKVDAEVEARLEALMRRPEAFRGAPNEGVGRIRSEPALAEPYVAHLAAVAGDALEGLRLAIDCANGSASALAPELFRALGADVTALGAEPDGTNINLGCGSTHPERLQEAVVEAGADLGLAFDGDADRLIAVDERGGLVDGDAVMGICALARLAAGTLRNGLLVVTVLSNGGLDRAIRQAGGRVVRTPVGDRHVLEEMERSGAMLGGEQSGHIIFREESATGDGLLTGIQLIRTLRGAGAPLSELAGRIPRLPQVMLNSAVRRRDAWRDDPEFASAVARAEAALADRGRVLVRPSGTEAKLRIMVEGDERGEIEAIARDLARLAQARLN